MTAPRFSIVKHRGPLAEGGSRTDAQSHDSELTRPRPGEEARMTDELPTRCRRIILEWLNRNQARSPPGQCLAVPIMTTATIRRKRRPSRHSAQWGLEQRKVKASPRGGTQF